MGSAPLPHPPSCDPLRRCLLGFASDCLDSCRSGSCGCHSLESRTPEKPFLFTSHLDQGRTGQTQRHRALLWPCFSLLSPPTPTSVWLVRDYLPSRFDLHRFHSRWSDCSTGCSS